MPTRQYLEYGEEAQRSQGRKGTEIGEWDFWSGALGALVLTCTLTLAACSGSDRGTGTEAVTASVEPNVVAVYEGGEISGSDLDAEVQGLAATSLAGTLGSSAKSYFPLLEEMAVGALLLEEARLLGISESREFQLRRRALERHLVVQEAVGAQQGNEAPTEESLLAEYQSRQGEFNRAERRLVYHIYLALDPGEGREGLLRDLEAIRQRLRAGETFPQLARELSDSESRHAGGRLGWFEQGQLPPDLDRVVFALEEGVPSQPLIVGDGGHLFLVDQGVAARHATFEQVRASLIEARTRHRTQEVLQELATKVERRPDVFLATSEELDGMVRRSNPNSVVLRVGVFELRLGDLERMIEADRLLRPHAAGDRGKDLLERLLPSELVYQDRIRQGWEPTSEQAKSLQSGSDQILLQLFREQRVWELATLDSAGLEEFYRNNRLRFASPLVLELRRLTVPTRTTAAMLRLEGAAAEAGSAVDLESLAEELGGSVDVLGPLTISSLASLDSRVPAFMAPLEVGERSPPFSVGDGIVLLEVVERREPEPQPFDRVRTAVTSAFVERHGQRLYDNLRTELLRARNFRVVEDHLMQHLSESE